MPSKWDQHKDSLKLKLTFLYYTFDSIKCWRCSVSSVWLVVSSNIKILMALDKWEFRTMLKLSRTNTHHFCYIFSSKITKNVSHFSITFFHHIFPRNSVHRIQFELIHWKLLKWNYAIVLRFDEFVNLFFLFKFYYRKVKKIKDFLTLP